MQQRVQARYDTCSSVLHCTRTNVSRPYRTGEGGGNRHPLWVTFMEMHNAHCVKNRLIHPLTYVLHTTTAAAPLYTCNGHHARWPMVLHSCTRRSSESDAKYAERRRREETQRSTINYLLESYNTIAVQRTQTSISHCSCILCDLHQ